MTDDTPLTPPYEAWELVIANGTFEAVYDALAAVVTRLEDGRLPLADSLTCYELGMGLAARCERYLQEAELRISRLDEANPPAAWEVELDEDELED